MFREMNSLLRTACAEGFYATGLDTLLRGRDVTHLLIAGVTTEVCVQTTMREANDRGYQCLLVEDATASYFPEFKAAVLEMVRAQGGIVGCGGCGWDEWGEQELVGDEDNDL